MRRRANLGGAVVALATVAFVVLLLVHWGGNQIAEGFGSYLGAFKDRYPAIAGSTLDDCTVCHQVPGGPRNTYGQSVEAELDAGESIDEALAAVESADSDGDGASNLDEISALTAPGNPDDSPAAATLTPAATPTPASPSTTPPATATPAPTDTPSRPPPASGPDGGGIFDSTETYVLLVLAGLAAAIGAAWVFYYVARPDA